MASEPLQWEHRGSVSTAKDGPLQYRIVMSKNKDDTWAWLAFMNGAKIGGRYQSLEAAIEYVEFGGWPPRRSKEQEANENEAGN